MNVDTQWTVQKGPTGYSLSRLRPHIMAETVTFTVPTAAARRWSLALHKVLQRLDHRRCHWIPLSFSLRLMTGCWRRDIRQVGYYGAVPRQSLHIICVGDALYLLANVYNWAAYPISREDIELMATNLA